MLRGIWQGLISVKEVKQKGWFFFHTVMIWALYLFSTYMGFFAMSDTPIPTRPTAASSPMPATAYMMF